MILLYSEYVFQVKLTFTHREFENNVRMSEHFFDPWHGLVGYH